MNKTYFVIFQLFLSIFFGEGIFLRIEHLFYLQEIVKRRSFSNAAESLFISQQSLSEAVAKLEKQFNLKIFERSRKGSQLTSEGEVFMKEVDLLLQQYQHILDQFASGKPEQQPKRSISVCINPVVSAFSFEQIIKSFHEAYPQIALSVTESHSPQHSIQYILDRKADIALTSIPLPSTTMTLYYKLCTAFTAGKLCFLGRFTQ